MEDKAIKPSHLFKSEIMMRDCVGSMTDELSYLYRSSNYALRNEGIKLKFSIKSDKNGAYLTDGSGEIRRLVEFHSVLMSYFFCWTKTNKISKSDMIAKIRDLILPVLFEEESVSITMNSAKFGRSKTVVIPVDSKTFHSKIHSVLRQKNIVEAFFQNKVKEVTQDSDGEIEIVIKLGSDSSSARVVLDNLADDLGTVLLEYMIEKGPAKELKEIMLSPKSVISLSHIAMLSETSMDERVEVAKEMQNRVDGVRELINRIQSGMSFDKELLNDIKTSTIENIATVSC